MKNLITIKQHEENLKNNIYQMDPDRKSFYPDNSNPNNAVIQIKYFDPNALKRDGTKGKWYFGFRIIKDFYLIVKVNAQESQYFELRDVDGTGSYSPDSNSYSTEYYKRLKMYDEGKIKHEEIYGLDQVREHAESLRLPKEGSKYNEYWKNKQFKIVKVVVKTTVIEMI